MYSLKSLSRWLAVEAPHDSVASLFASFCGKAVRESAPIHRASLTLEELHPEVSVWQHVWTRDGVSVRDVGRANAPTSRSYLQSPTRIVDESERPFRQRLDGPVTKLPLLEELRLDGHTDYVMYPLPFLDRTRTAVISFATSLEGGFDDEGILELQFAVQLLSPYLERHVLRRISTDRADLLSGPYLASHAAPRVPHTPLKGTKAYYRAG